VRAPAGQEIKLRFAEMLEADGTLHTKNLRTARATARYIARGGGTETWEPRFTYFGFRYVELSGVPAPADDAVTGVVMHTDLPRIGRFECSQPLLNKLFANTLWGQKGNFLELPTDCPQRNERLGWTGDAQVFCNTANYNLASGAFYRQWSWALADSFKDGVDGGYGDVAPDTGLKTGSAGWGDAGVIVPWVTWLHTGDRRVLEENFDTIQRWIALQEAHWPDGIRRSKQSYGDWLAPGYPANKAPTPYVLIATAYFARSTQLAAQMADVLGLPELAVKYRALWAKIKTAFRKEFIAADGRITSDEQTAYLLALGFDLAPDELRPAMVEHLLRVVAAKDNHLATGFLGTPLLAPVLTQLGRTDLVYTVVQQETYPGWLFSVKNGATTIWERWDSWTPDRGFNKDGMNSFNHYAYGSIVEWFYDTVAGLKPDAAAPGWKRFHIAPQPGGGLTHVKAAVETPYGVAACRWRLEDRRLFVEIDVPANTEALVRLPAAKAGLVREGGRPLERLRDAKDVKVADGSVAMMLPAGSYWFTIDAQ
jgi:alpha-L-rhamnosidase